MFDDIFEDLQDFISTFSLKKEGNKSQDKGIPQNGKTSVSIELLDTMPNLYRKEIKDWKRARTSAYSVFNPSRWELMDLYRDATLDNHLSAVIESRILSVINKAFKIKDADGEVDEDKTKLLNKSWLDSYLKAAMESLFYGYTCLQFWTNEKGVVEVKEIPRKHIVPEKHCIIKQQGDQKGLDYTAEPFNKWILTIELDKGMGILEKASPLTILKRHSLGSWDLYEARFGIPLILAKTINTSLKYRAKLGTWLKKLGQAAFGVFDKGTEIEIKEASGIGNYEVFDKKVERVNSEISKLILGQTMTSDNGSSRSQSEVHKGTEDKRTIADTKLIINHLNDVLIPFLRQHEAYSFLADGDVFYIDDTYILSPTERIAIDSQIVSMGYKMTTKYMEKNYDVEIEDDKNIKDTEAEPKQSSNNETDKSEGKEAKKKSKDQKQSLRNTLNLYYEPCPTCAKDKSIQLDFEDVPDGEIDWEAIVLAIAKKIYEGAKIKEAPKKLRDSIYKMLLAAFTKGFGVYKDFPEKQKAFEFFKKNLYKFSSAKSMFEVLSMQEVLLDAEGAIVSFAEFKKRVKALNIEFNVVHLKTEYNHVIKAGQAASNWIEYEKDSDLFPNLQYKTKGDKRVRPQHANLDNIILSINDSFWDMYYPPNGWNCRCFVLQMPSDAQITSTSTAKTKGEKAKVSNTFAYNVGKEKKVFEETTHPYFTGTT